MPEQPKKASKAVLDLKETACSACNTPGSVLISKSTNRGFCFACGKIDPHKVDKIPEAGTETCPKCKSPRIGDRTPGGGSMFCGDCQHTWQRGAEALSLKVKPSSRYERSE